jgi:multiphosphoryl transfer protein
VGVMVEVPSAALAADAFGDEVDFFSIGTNDLTQYTLAAERGNERVAAIADPLHPAVLRLIQLVAEAGQAHGKWVGICGELGGDTLATPVLIGLGVTELSAAPPLVPGVKDAVRAVALRDARGLAAEALGLESAAAVRDLLRPQLVLR